MNYQQNNQSQFTGGLLGLIGVNICSALLIALTLGLCAPWAVCFKERWIAKHTYIDGRQLMFDGTLLRNLSLLNFGSLLLFIIP